MKKVLVSLMVLWLAPALATAAVTSPEGFEGYATTDDWSPTEAVEGWTTAYLWPGDSPGGDYVWKGEIKTSAVSPNTSQVHSVIPWESNPGDMQGGLVSTWYKSLPDSGGSITSTSWDFAPVGNVLGDQFGIHVSRLNDDSLPPPYADFFGGNQAANVSWQVGIVWGYFGGLDPAHEYMVYLQTLTAEDTWVEEAITGIDINEFGIYAVGYNYDKWWTVEVEEDNVLSKTRARIYEKSTSPGDEDGWTSWLDHHPTLHGLDYSTGGKVVVRSQGFMEFDNFSMTQPGPAGNPGDANNDLVVSADDYGSVQLNFGATGAVNIPGDANLDGVVSADDYGSVQVYFGTVYGAGGATVPEPATMLLLGAGSLLLLKRKRKA